MLNMIKYTWSIVNIVVSLFMLTCQIEILTLSIAIHIDISRYLCYYDMKFYLKLKGGF